VSPVRHPLPEVHPVPTELPCINININITR
jgi:hypothetical protein